MFGEQAFSVAGPAAWNTLPVDIRTTSSTPAFKKKSHDFSLSQLLSHFSTLRFLCILYFILFSYLLVDWSSVAVVICCCGHLLLWSSVAVSLYCHLHYITPQGNMIETIGQEHRKLREVSTPSRNFVNFGPQTA